MAAFLPPFPCSVHGSSLRSSAFTHSPPVSLRPARLRPASPARIDVDIPASAPRRQSRRTVPTLRSFDKPAPKPFSKNTKKKQGQPKRTPLHKLRVGERLEGTVRNLVPWGAYIDVGAVRDGLVHVRNMSEDYVEHPAEVVGPDDVVHAYVKYVDPKKNVLGLSLLPILMDYEWTERTKVHQLEIGSKKIARVVRITNYGVYVDIGATRDAWVHIGNLWGESTKKTLNELLLGEKFDVVVDSVDVKKSFINCRARTNFGTKKLTAEEEEDGEEKELIVKWEEDYGHRGPGYTGERPMRDEEWLAIGVDEPEKEERDREAKDGEAREANGAEAREANGAEAREANGAEARDGVSGRKEDDIDTAKLEESVAKMLEDIRVLEDTDEEFDEEFDDTDEEFDETDEEEDASDAEE